MARELASIDGASQSELDSLNDKIEAHKISIENDRNILESLLESIASKSKKLEQLKARKDGL